jgi:hypothetical protein|tara:strand:- start:1719 stop:1850 length:132 start_codon:yes stop_codon:yes gene_type:complete
MILILKTLEQIIQVYHIPIKSLKKLKKLQNVSYMDNIVDEDLK